MFIELHLLQNFVPSNLNRDESNNPKDCVFGGVRRARISSQCLKRAIRLHPIFEKATEVHPADRTRYLAVAITEKLVTAGKTSEEAAKAATNVSGSILGGMDSKTPQRSKVLFFVSEEEINYLTDLILKNWEAALVGDEKKDNKPFTDIKKEFKETFKDRTSAPAIALFGRMLAEDPKLSMDAACQVAHAISTHRISMEFDFFTAVDDLQKKDETGAGMMGIIGFNAATFYRYARIDFDQLLKNLNGDLNMARKSVEGFLRASVLAVPTGKQTSFAAQNPPTFMLAVTREDGMSWSLANAFEKPVFSHNDQGILALSAEKLDTYWGELVNFYGNSAHPIVATVGIDTELPNLSQKRCNNFDTWINGILEKLPKE